MLDHADFGEKPYPVVVVGQRRDDSHYIQAVVVAHDYRPPVVVFSIYSTTPLWATRENLSGLYRYAFHILKVNRVTALVEKGNRKSRNFLEHVGFKLEGVARRALANGHDVCLYGLIRSDEFDVGRKRYRGQKS